MASAAARRLLTGRTMLTRMSRWGTLSIAAWLWATAAPAEDSKATPAAPAASAETTWQEPAADEPAPKIKAARRERPLDHWYGWQTLLLDGAATGTILLGTTNPEGVGIALAGLVGFVVSGPVVHGIHERPAGRVLGSLGLRLGLPLLGGIVGSSVADCRDAEDFDDVGGAYCQIGYIGLGGLVGLGAAAIADAALSFEPSRRAGPSSG